jgi:lysophospholipase L1-like esterase
MKSFVAAAAMAALLIPASAQTANQPNVWQPDGRSPTADPSITDRPPVKPIATKKIILVGDSTTQVNSGWGGSFCAYHVSAFTACVNLARGGRSTYSYRAEGSWTNALNEMKTPGYGAVYVLIQFGHNDQPGKAGRSTNLETEFPANLRAYVQEARAAGAIPVLLTPLTRRMFYDGKVRDSLDAWAEKTRAVAAALNVPLVDLYARSQAAVQGIGPAEAARLAMLPPPPEVLEAAKTGNIVPQSKLPKLQLTPEQARKMAADLGVPLSDLASLIRPGAEENVTAQTKPVVVPGPHATSHPSFDYTHVGRTGADYFSAIVADGLARAVPELSNDLLP